MPGSVAGPGAGATSGDPLAAGAQTVPGASGTGPTPAEQTESGAAGGGPTAAQQDAAAPAAAAADAACGAGAPAGGNGGATDTGVTATSIKIGGTFFNGGYLDKYSQVAENGARAYFNFVNDQGGICGRKIEFITCDTAGTADGTSGCLNKLADQQKVFSMGPSLDFNLDIVQKALADRELPWVGSSGLYDAEFTSPWMYPTQPPGGAIGGLIATHATQKLGSKKIGVSALRNGAGPSCTARAEKVAAANGARVVAVAENNEVETGLDNQVSTLKNAGVDTVLFCNDPVNNIKFIQAAQRSGWKPIFVGGFVAVDDVPTASGSNARGMYGLTMYDFYKSETPGVKQYREITEFYYPGTFHHFYEQAAYVGAAAIVEALRQTGPTVTRTGFLQSLRGMRAFDIGLGLKLDFANLKDQTPSGMMLRADDNLVWKVASPRFTTS
jgi:branched-chain amino acid transport system substrate-binding protein